MKQSRPGPAGATISCTQRAAGSVDEDRRARVGAPGVPEPVHRGVRDAHAAVGRGPGRDRARAVHRDAAREELGAPHVAELEARRVVAVDLPTYVELAARRAGTVGAALRLVRLAVAR